MNHDQIKEKLHAHHDGELPRQEHIEITAHLGACDDCRSDYDAWKNIATTLFKPLELSPSEAFVSRVMSQISPASQPSTVFSLWQWLWEIPALGAGFAAMLFAFTIHSVEAVISTETLLSPESRQTTLLQWIDPQPETAMTDDLLDINVEEL